MTSPANNATATAPASFTLTANAADSDGTIANVKFYQGTTLLGSVTASPYSYTWNNVAMGSYSLTAVATDNYGVQTTSAAVSVTVNSGVAQAYYIHTDQLDTPREITDTNGNVVWQWDNSDPFGANMANENPNGAGTFSFNLRFPGQYYDRETNLHYNINRDYDPSIGRYIQSDPIGLDGGINTYTYVYDDPVEFADPQGLFSYNAPSPTTKPLTQTLADLVSKLEKCIGLHLVVTGGSEPHGGKHDPHAAGAAVDFSFLRNPALKALKAQFLCCAAQSGFTFAWEEPNQWTRGAPSHFHLESPTYTQVGNQLPDPATCKKCSK